MGHSTLTESHICRIMGLEIPFYKWNTKNIQLGLNKINEKMEIYSRELISKKEQYKSFYFSIFLQQKNQMNKILFIACLLLATSYCWSDCPAGQFPRNQECTPYTFIQGCALYSENNQCQTCEYGYVKSQSTCEYYGGNVEECCLQFDLHGKCKECAQGLYLEENKCKRNSIIGCVAKNGPLCQACGRGYFLANNQCQKMIIGCEQYADNGACSRCTDQVAVADGCGFKFVLRNGLCFKTKVELYQVTNYTSKCRARNAFGCVQCEKDYFLDENRKCQPYEQGCLLYFQGQCKQCSTFRGFNLVHGKCVNKYEFHSVANCAQYSAQNDGLKCLGCRFGFRLTENNKCVAEHLLEIKIKKPCANGFYLSSSYKCKKSSGNLNKEIEYEEEETEVNEPGCIYQNGVCEFCQEPFKKVDGRCSIPNCMQFEQVPTKFSSNAEYECLSCRYPYTLESNGQCVIPFCAKYKSNRCVLCSVGYHLKAYEYCHADDLNCLGYDVDGNCEQCADNYFISSSGECMLKESNCLTHFLKEQMPVCTACVDGFFLNRHNQCQKIDENCEFYVNGVCKMCRTRFFLHEYICFPYTIGCVKYSGADCVECKRGYTHFNNECFTLETLGMKLEGEDDQYDFDIYPIDITKSKYYIQNLSPISVLGEFIYSSAYSREYTDPALTFEDSHYSDSNRRANGWKALNNKKGQYAGFKINQGEEPVTFYAVQLEFIEENQINSFYLEYNKDGQNWIRVENRFFVEDNLNSQSPEYLIENGIITIYFTGIYAEAIRIVVDEYEVWPACRIEFFYYDLLRFRKISNLKSLRYLRESIQSNFVDRLDNQLYINQKYFFNPEFECHSGEDLTCFTGLELCEARRIPSIELVNENKHQNGLNSYVSEFYITYSQNGRNFQCFDECQKFTVAEKDLEGTEEYQTLNIDFEGLVAKNVRVYPTKWFGTPKLTISFDHEFKK